ncbi:MAG: AI-2E family transporter [Syntrophomonadaceae bacterium]|nr:AI-2E family transporter [Syntrophomonadaceae bacterium]
MLLKNKVFRYIIFGVVAFATLCFVYLVREVVYTFLAGALLAYFLFRPVVFIEQRGLPRIWGIVIIYLLLAALAALLLWIAVPRLIKELNEFAAMMPAYAAQLEDISGRMHNLHLPGKLDLMLQDNTARIENFIFAQLKGMVNGIYAFFSKALVIVFAPILAIYIIKDWEKIKAALLFILPPASRREALILTDRIDSVWIEYLKGHLLVSALVGLATGIAALIIGVEFALVIGIIAALTNLVPYFGPILGGIPAIALALVQSWQDGLYMAIAIILIQQLESNLLTPKIIGDKLGMHPLIVVFALLAGGELLGILGMLIAVPLTAALRIIISSAYLKFVE